MVLLQLCCWKFSHKRNTVANFIRLNLNFITKTTNSLFEPPFGGVRGNVRTSSIARWNARVDFLFATTEQFSLAFVRLRRYKQILAEGCVLGATFRLKGTSPNNLCCFQKTRMIALTCGIKISVVYSLFPSQSTSATDDRRMDRHTYDHQDRASIAA